MSAVVTQQIQNDYLNIISDILESTGEISQLDAVKHSETLKEIATIAPPATGGIATSILEVSNAILDKLNLGDEVLDTRISENLITVISAVIDGN